MTRKYHNVTYSTCLFLRFLRMSEGFFAVCNGLTYMLTLGSWWPRIGWDTHDDSGNPLGITKRILDFTQCKKR